MIAYQTKVVIPTCPTSPHPLEQPCESTQLPARPQSEAEITVVGQNPQIPFLVSTLQSKPGFAVRGWPGSPSAKPHVVMSVTCLFSMKRSTEELESDFAKRQTGWKLRGVAVTRSGRFINIERTMKAKRDEDEKDIVIRTNRINLCTRRYRRNRRNEK
jgi:hypothetical protein